MTVRLLLLAAFAALLSNAAAAQVSFERIRNAQNEPANWLTYSGSLSGQRFSPLKELTPANVGRLRVRWAYQFPESGNEVSPIVADGVMYVSWANAAAALDVKTGRPLWFWKRDIPADYHSIGFGRVNRGPAILGDTLYVTTLDGYLVALDAKSGGQRWIAQVADYQSGYSITVAPLAINGKILVGVSGGEAGIRGLLDAYDVKTGERIWRFWTIPTDGETGFDSWSGDSARRGGGPTWVTGSYDPELKLIYWGVGNPSPDWNGDSRNGDNLYTCSVIAVDSETGTLRWYFQFTPHDTHDWDSSHVPVLFDAAVAGKPRKLIAVANRNGFYYVLDRVTGEFIAGQPYIKQTWARGLDAKGRPVVIPGTEPTEAGVLVYPNLSGGTVWFSPSYSPRTKLFYIPAREVGGIYFKREAEFKIGTMFAGGGEDELPLDQGWGAIRALEATTGNKRWEFRLNSPATAGILSTAGGLVFSGADEGNFFALDAATGKPLWEFQTGSSVHANPISFMLEGHQCIAIAADRVLYVFGL
jgi:alcohol dehydrogenase (cytochrome c)